MKEIISTIKQKLQAASDPEVKEKILRLTSGAKCIGVKVPVIRDIAKSIKKEYELSFEEARELFDILCVDKCREKILFCIFLLALFPKKQMTVTWQQMEKWLPYIDNWETCDQLSCNIAIVLLHADENNFVKLMEYTQSPNLWIRRFAAATAANSNHGRHSYPKQTKEICDRLKDEKEPMVKKAIKWALSEIHE
jgi:3-methyladenine DNA glycosylase AlkD